MTALKKPQTSQMVQIFLSSNFASLRLCVSFFRQSQPLLLKISGQNVSVSCQASPAAPG